MDHVTIYLLHPSFFRTTLMFSSYLFLLSLFSWFPPPIPPLYFYFALCSQTLFDYNFCFLLLLSLDLSELAKAAKKKLQAVSFILNSCIANKTFIVKTYTMKGISIFVINIENCVSVFVDLASR